MQKTNYTIEKIDSSSWVRILKDGIFIGSAIDDYSAMQKIFTDEGKPHDDFYTPGEDGIVFKVDRGVL